MQEAGFDLRDDTDNAEHCVAAALALTERLTGVRLTPELLEESTYPCGIAPATPANSARHITVIDHSRHPVRPSASARKTRCLPASSLVNPAFQIADRPDARASRSGQSLLRHASVYAQLPRTLSERLRRLSGRSAHRKPSTGKPRPTRLATQPRRRPEGVDPAPVGDR
jgi:hypothetical protein